MWDISSAPADVINIGRIDPFDAEAPREGPLALKAHYPMGSNNYYVYVIFEDMESIGDVAVAPKVEYVVGRTEMGLGAFYRDGRPLQLMGTLSSTLGKVSVFGEAVLVVDSQSGPGERLDWQWTVGGDTAIGMRKVYSTLPPQLSISTAASTRRRC